MLPAILAATTACSQTPRSVATVAAPAEIPLVIPAGMAKDPDGERFVDIPVNGFRPSPAGPVQIVVDALTGTVRTEIGRFAIYPERPIDSANAQHFSLAVPAGLHVDSSTRLVVRIAPSRGSGEGALVELGSGRMRSGG